MDAKLATTIASCEYDFCLLLYLQKQRVESSGVPPLKTPLSIHVHLYQLADLLDA
uniref:Uncharacterized protein n=1 Tax=Nelumbo nucifera TaxID=4432 RepID=A0A822Y080_NELNU|nr:TPA_asm: hypothetical protein HUJ06_026099 [Nelumbo nucifera]DAD24656.1 TPA_asm: hypothetical protein HUJ06_026120 [Nelumbo nucifera]